MASKEFGVTHYWEILYRYKVSLNLNIQLKQSERDRENCLKNVQRSALSLENLVDNCLTHFSVFNFSLVPLLLKLCSDEPNRD